MTRHHHPSGALHRGSLALALILAGTVALSGCENPDRSLQVTVTNNTASKLIIRVGGTPGPRIEAGQTEVEQLPTSSSSCEGNINAITEFGAEIAIHTGELCHGDTWVIDQSDLVPIEDTTYAPSS
jgi:hypothetical protein